MWSTWTEKAKEAMEKTGEAISSVEKSASKGISDALEKTGEAYTKATTPSKGSSDPDDAPASSNDDATSPDSEAATESANADDVKAPASTARSPMSLPAVNMPTVNMNGEKMFKNFQAGWSSVVESTKRTVEATTEAVDTQRARLEQNFLRKGFYKRDPNLPLDVEALRDAEVVYITDRIITMSHPAMASSKQPNITAQRKLAAVAQLLQRRHDGRFLVWNLSEVEYDITILDNQVLTFSFPGSPSPPLGLLLKLLISMENWMKADERNIAVVHCLTGKGRTSTVLASFLCWMGEAGFADIHQAIAYIAKCKQMTPEQLTIPSQRRYAAYFKNMLDGVRPSQPPLLLKRIIMSEAPKFAKGPSRDSTDENGQPITEDNLMGCAPYLQIFKAGQLIFTTAATLHVQQSEEELPFVQVMDGTVPFNVNEVIQGDILIRCRHLTFKKQRVSMFRSAFHTGYVPPNVLRLTKSQLDGACSDRRYPDDFFLDLIFEKVDAKTASAHLEKQNEETADEKDAEATGKATDEKEKGPIVTASGMDTMLHGDSRFWEVISNRREQHVKQTTQNDGDAMCGRTVGRRRGDRKPTEGSPDKPAGPSSSPGSAEPLFSIGGELDFLPGAQTEQSPAKTDQSDFLMDALNALEDDEAMTEDLGTEEVVFDSSKPAPQAEKPVAAPIADPIAAASDSTELQSKPTAVETSSEAKAEETTVVAEIAAEASVKVTPEPTPAPAEAETGDDMIDDMDALLASADEALEDFGDLNLEDLDDDDADLDDLEAMLAM